MTTKKEESWYHHLKVLWIVLGIPLIIGLCYSVWRYPEIYSQWLAIIISATIGAALTAIITSLVVDSRLKNEQEKEKNIKIYELKLRVYSKFLSKMWNLYNDGQELSKVEFYQLKLLVFNQLIFLLSNARLKEMKNTIENLSRSFEENISIPSELSKITAILQEDLASNTPVGSLNWQDVSYLWGIFADKEMIDNCIGGNKDVSTNDNKSIYTYWCMNMIRGQEEKQREALNNGCNELSLAEWGEYKRTNALKQIKSGDIIFLYNKGNTFLGVYKAKGRRIIYNDSRGLCEELVEDLHDENSVHIITDEAHVNQDIKSYDIYNSIKGGASVFANIIVETIAKDNKQRPASVPVPQHALRRLNKKQGEELMILYNLHDKKNNF